MCIRLVPLLFLVACRAAPAVEVEAEVRALIATLQRDLADQGPAAWGTHFQDDEAFFMASDGRLLFPDRASLDGFLGE